VAGAKGGAHYRLFVGQAGERSTPGPNVADLDSPSGRDWQSDPYPDYARDIETSIKFSGLDLHFFTRGKMFEIERVARDRFTDPSKISCLDIGCGIALGHRWLEGRFASLTGVDVSAEAIDKATIDNPHNRYCCYDGKTLPFDAGTFDIAFTICVLHHVPPSHWLHFLNDAQRVLRPDGVFLVIEHNPFNPLTQLTVFRCPFDRDAHLLRPARLRRLMRQSGFSGVKSYYIFAVPLSGRIGNAANRGLSSLPIGAQYVTVGKPAR
jgi:SAM-dependent methyltransferase